MQLFFFDAQRTGRRLLEDPREGAVRFSGRVEGAFAWMFGGPNVQVHILVPREFGLDLRCTTGSIRIEDMNGRVRARTVSDPSAMPNPTT